MSPPRRASTSGTALEIAFIPMVCAVPLLHAAASGLFAERGLDVTVRPVPDWNAVFALMEYGRVDATHALVPLTLAAAVGVQCRASPWELAAIQNVNGSALVLASKWSHVERVAEMKGFTIGVPHRFSMQFFLLSDLLAHEGLDPRADVTIVELPPPRMARKLAQGALDAAFTPEPFGQVMVDDGTGVVFTLSHDLWPEHPCCGLSIPTRLREEEPAVARALADGLMAAEAELAHGDAETRRGIARSLVARGFFQGMVGESLEKALSTAHVDRRGHARAPAERVGFQPLPSAEHGAWILAQMQRWGQLAGPIDYADAARRVMRGELVAERASHFGFPTTVAGVHAPSPFSADAPLESVLRLPFCAYHPEPPPPRRHELAEPVRERLRDLLAYLTDVAAGRRMPPLEVTSDDEVGALERAVNASTRSQSFVREALEEQLELEEHARRQEARILEQAALIRELETPIMPVLDGVLLLPLVGRIDAARAAAITDALLTAIGARGAEEVILDMTGVPALDEADVSFLSALSSAARLLGATCVLVGVSAPVARALVALPDKQSLPHCVRDLQSAIAGALRRRAIARRTRD